MTRCIHITPELPPTVGGIADYTVILSRRLVEVTEGAVAPVIVRAGWKRDASPETAFPHVDLGGQCSASALAETIGRLAGEAEERAVVLLEYSGYGYAKRGAPLWLARGLRQACAAGGVPLVTMYHELYATSRKPWTSTFWLSPVQRRVAARIARLSDGLMTNREASAAWLRSYAGDAPVKVSPTFSNVGEPETLPPYEEREPYAVVFGGARRKAALYEQHGVALGPALQRMGIGRIVDIGTPPPEAAVSGLVVPIETKGVLPAEEISACLRWAAAGVLEYPPEYITKSGVWAAYAAHGVPAVVVTKRERIRGFEEGRHFMQLNTLTNTTFEPERHAEMGRTIKQWYDEEAHSRQAGLSVQLLVANKEASRNHEIA